MKKFYLCLILMAIACLPFFAKGQQFNLNAPTGTAQFGSSVTVLTNGNYVVVDPLFNSNLGAVYLYNGNNHALISTLTGSTANDKVGEGGVIALPNGNFVVRSPFWNNGAVADAGAVTWGSGTVGVSGTVSASNSLVGGTANDRVGYGSSNQNGVVPLANGNYVVSSPLWDGNKGAATWCSGAIGLSGLVSASNSLVGVQNLDQVSYGHSNNGITALANGNYIVNSANWDNGSIENAGAVTWVNGATGIVGEVDASNSLVGSTAGDYVGMGLIIKLTNGNYVVNSFNWDNGSFVNAGAATWADASIGITGVIHAGNSLIGAKVNDNIGNGGITALTNGNYVISSYNYDNGSVLNTGAITWGNGATGTVGLVSNSNSMVGSSAMDFVGIGGIIALTNGNYVVRSMNWDNGSVIDAGAVTWGNGAAVMSGVVTAANSLVGSRTNDMVGNGGVTPLTNGNYVIRSFSWDNGLIENAGAATFGSGTTGVVGVISANNSIGGITANDEVSSSGVTALANGNYVVRSPSWDNGAVVNAGAATWGDGAIGVKGVLNAANSLIGSSSYDQIGSVAVTGLSNGNYVVNSSGWDDGPIVNVGAVTWGNGATGITGFIQASNSLVGSIANDQVGSQPIAVLLNGEYVVHSKTWSNSKGAVTKSGATGVTGVVSVSNSLIGSKINDQVGNVSAIGFNNGSYGVISRVWDNGSYADGGAVSISNGTASITGIINGCNSVLGSSVNSGTTLGLYYNATYDYHIVCWPKDNSVTIFTPSAISLANTLDAVSINLHDNAPTDLIANNGCRILATITPNGANAISGTINARVWLENTVPTDAGKPFVARHYQITPINNAATATGKITLYFTQQEFTDFNNHAGSTLNLPQHEADALGKSNLRIGKFSGNTNNGTGLPNSYSGNQDVINPDDSDIVWNSALGRWEISFDVIGFSGFVVQTSPYLLPLTLLDFNGILHQNHAVLNWKTDHEVNTANFDVERSVDNKNFKAIGNVKAANTAGVHNYEFTDIEITKLGAPIVYYRLKQLDTNGAFAYSKIVAIAIDIVDFVLLYPNPVKEEANLIITASKADKVQLSITDNLGRFLKQQQLLLNAGKNSLSIDVADLPSGIYYLQLKGNVVNVIKVFVKQ